MKTALITGITGQDGFYLTDYLLKNNYKIHGTVRRSSLINTSRIDPLISEYQKSGRLNLHYSDLLDSASVSSLINTIMPDEIYNLGAQSHVAGPSKILYLQHKLEHSVQSQYSKELEIVKKILNFQASSSEMYGGEGAVTLNEESLFNPKSPYAASKVFAHHMTTIYRESYDVFGVNGILFNHESPHRGETFVTRKITRVVGRISLGMQRKLTLGNLDASRDWGFAGDYVKAMHLMMQHEKADDWVISTGETHTVREFAEIHLQELI